MSFTQEGNFYKGRMLLGQVIENLEKALEEGRDIDSIERGLHRDLRSIGETLSQEYVDAMGTRDLGPTLEVRGRTLKRLPNLHDRRYVAIFGELKISRTVYETLETRKHEAVPLDSRLKTLIDLTCRLCGDNFIWFTKRFIIS